MNRGAWWFAPVVALGALAFVLFQTMHALEDSGVWRFRPRPAQVAQADPLAALDGLIARTQAQAFAGASRDPFGYGAAAPRPEPARPVVRRPAVPPPPAVPVLTAIIYDADPRAIVRWQGRDFTVHPGGLFDEFTVQSINRDQVVLRRGTETIVLRRQP